MLGAPMLEPATGHGVSGIPRRHAMALLALLAAHAPRPVCRDRVVALLWPDSDEAHARHGLAQVVYALRRAMHPRAIATDGISLALDPEHVTADVVRFRDHLAQGDLARAVALYDGPFLDGFHLPGSGEFTEWVEAERAALAAAAGQALERLAAGADAAGDAPEALAWWRRRAALDPGNRRVALALAGALHAAGDSAGAAAHARVYASLTGDTLPTPPPAPVAASPAVAATATAASSPERDADDGERELLRDLFDEAPAPYLVTDAAGTIERVNAAARHLLAGCDLPLVGTPLAAFVPPAHRGVFARTLRALADGAAPPPRALPLPLDGRHAVADAAPCARAAVSVARDPNGRAHRLRWVLHDVAAPPAADAAALDAAP
jgi:DNA-binding SARP family transcriptional activator